jgi:hypothetical protein
MAEPTTTTTDPLITGRETISAAGNAAASAGLAVVAGAPVHDP